MVKNKTSVDKLTIKHFYEVSLLFRRQFLLGCLTPVAALGTSVAVPYFIGKILGSLARPGVNITPLIYGLVIVSILSVLLNRIAYNNYLSFQPKVMAYLQTEALQALVSRGSSFHNSQISGKLVSDAVDYPSAFNQLTTTFFVDALPFLMIVVFGLLLVAISSPLLGLILLLMTALAIGSSLYFRRRMTPYRMRRQAASKAVTAHIGDTIVNNQTVHTFAIEDYELKTHKRLNDTLLGARLHDWHEVARDGNQRIFSLLLFEILFVIIVVHQVRSNPALLATGIFGFSYTVTLSNRLFQIAGMMRSIEEALLLASPITELLQERPEIQDVPGAKKLAVKSGAIELSELNFQYQDNAAQDAVFSDLNLSIRPGEKVGLVGPSGGGKSTLTRLLLRFEDIQSGSITIDGQNIAEVTQNSLRTQIAYVPQEPLLFHRSIRDNIAYGMHDADEAGIREAARKAYALDFIESLPQGFDTVVGERGVKLSGGQRQRVAIARVILKNAPILILDEATSALDSESEQVIQKALQELMENRTAIVIAHRLSTIQRMDRIIVMDNGRIVEQGSHDQLLKTNGLYAKLWGHQSGGFIEE